MMKKYLLIFLILFSQVAHADDIGTRINVDQVLVFIHLSCTPYYSLYPPGIICKDGRTYQNMFRIEYEVRGQKHVETMDFIPEEKFPVNDYGEIIENDVAPMPRY